MRIAWYLGFGWISIAVLLASGVAINVLAGWAAWLFYLPFLAVALYMTVRLRLHTTQPWRRVHGRLMIDYARLATAEYDEAKKRGRAFDVAVPCRELAQKHLRVPDAADLVGAGRQAYYTDLVARHPQVFLEGIGADRHDAALAGVRSDIAASELGPDVVIARTIEQEHGGAEAARYLHALLLGRVL